MYLGHYGLALGAKKYAPSVSFGTAFLAVQFLDLLWPLFLLCGFEHVKISPGITPVTPLDFVDYPYTHSFAMSLLWGAAFGAVHYSFRRNAKAAVLLSLLVVSHWALDFVSHRPDLPLYPGGSQLYGLGLWNSISATLVVELPIFIGGLYLYLRGTRARNKIGSIALWSFVALNGFFYTWNYFGSLPPNESALAWSALTTWLFVPWAYWIDRNREVVMRYS